MDHFTVNRSDSWEGGGKDHVKKVAYSKAFMRGDNVPKAFVRNLTAYLKNLSWTARSKNPEGVGKSIMREEERV